ncbi:uncharacterized protein CLUP02_14621 [Colletotrichum lupini]|uniref:Uncharacterized protein n=1 Tax=Colletotrichum lupini TaxID=145971 RepID=A0A9Q8WMI1_9PEZI|nr:uncharacterized protein CLUP02_14621 [Colletotrichum lupini]UQC89093.1 hypothetical protein CLUP02_14621 [Colletotrichum lupini]
MAGPTSFLYLRQPDSKVFIPPPRSSKLAAVAADLQYRGPASGAPRCRTSALQPRISVVAGRRSNGGWAVKSTRVFGLDSNGITNSTPTPTKPHGIACSSLDGGFVFVSLIAVRILCGYPPLTALVPIYPQRAAGSRGERSEVRLSRAPLASECGADVGYLPASSGVLIGESWRSVLHGSVDDSNALVVALHAQYSSWPIAVLLYRIFGRASGLEVSFASESYVIFFVLVFLSSNSFPLRWHPPTEVGNTYWCQRLLDEMRIRSTLWGVYREARASIFILLSSMGQSMEVACFICRCFDLNRSFVTWRCTWPSRIWCRDDAGSKKAASGVLTGNLFDHPLVSLWTAMKVEEHREYSSSWSKSIIHLLPLNSRYPPSVTKLNARHMFLFKPGDFRSEGWRGPRKEIIERVLEMIQRQDCLSSIFKEDSTGSIDAADPD